MKFLQNIHSLRRQSILQIPEHASQSKLTLDSFFQKPPHRFTEVNVYTVVATAKSVNLRNIRYLIYIHRHNNFSINSILRSSSLSQSIHIPLLSLQSQMYLSLHRTQLNPSQNRCRIYLVFGIDKNLQFCIEYNFCRIANSLKGMLHTNRIHNISSIPSRPL